MLGTGIIISTVSTHINQTAISLAVHQYFIKTHWIVKKIFPNYVWDIPSVEKNVYLTFDDGPHPDVTHFVLDLLNQYKASATFFCIGENVINHPEVYNNIIENGHTVGNHTQHHLNGWETDSLTYLQDVIEASKIIDSNLFRPPFGRIKSRQYKGINRYFPMKKHIIMWDVLSADFDTNFTPAQCLNNVLKNVTPGSIVVFHDSEKAFPNLKAILPVVLEDLSGKGYKFESINEELL